MSEGERRRTLLAELRACLVLMLAPRHWRTEELDKSDANWRSDSATLRRAKLPEALCPHAHASRFSMIDNSGP